MSPIAIARRRATVRAQSSNEAVSRAARKQGFKSTPFVTGEMGCNRKYGGGDQLLNAPDTCNDGDGHLARHDTQARWYKRENRPFHRHPRHPRSRSGQLLYY